MLLHSLQPFGAPEKRKEQGENSEGRRGKPSGSGDVLGKSGAGGWQEGWQLSGSILAKNILYCVLFWDLFCGVFFKGDNCGYMRCAFPFFFDYFKQSTLLSKDLVDN